MVVMSGVVERYLESIVAHDWDGLRECLAGDVVRVGPYGDRYEGRDAYLAFISDLMPRLAGYEMRVDRVTYASDVLAFAELSETVETDGKLKVTPEALVFDLRADGRIAHVEIFMQTPSP
jgi:ketosteroid isomerase-like protein